MYDIRVAREEDRDQVVTLLTREFKAIDAFEEDWVDSWRNYWNRPEYDDWAFVATHNDQVVANLAYFVNRELNNIRGTHLCFSGVWAVATDARHRRKGLLRGIYEQAFPDMNERGVVLSILEPSPWLGAQIAYERMGYAVAERRVKHTFPPDILRPCQGDRDISARALEDPDENTKLSELESTMTRFGSRVYTFPLFFSQRIKSGNFFIFERGSQPVGCVRIVSSSSESDTILKVDNASFASDDVLPSIIDFIIQKSADATNVEWVCDPQIPVRKFSHHVKGIQSEYHESMMMRVVNFKGYCESIRVPEGNETAVTMKITDDLCPWNEGVYDLSFSNGELGVEVIGVENDADVALNPYELANVIGGQTLPSKLRNFGMIDCSLDTAQKLDAIFPIDSFQSYFRF
jgi:predicted acetyltransferase